MNNFNALSQYIASVNQAVNSLAKNNVDIMNRLRTVETASSGAFDQEKQLRIVDDIVAKAKAEILASLSKDVSAIKADIMSEVSGALSKLSADFEQKLAKAQPAPEAFPEISEIVIPELAPEAASLAGPADEDDDIIIGMKKEAPRRRGKARA